MKIKILGYDWKITVLKKKEFKRRFKGCYAINLPDKKEIYFRTDTFNKQHVIHELAHAFVFYSCKEEIELTQDQYEEYLCDFLHIHGEEIFRLTKKILSGRVK